MVLYESLDHTITYSKGLSHFPKSIYNLRKFFNDQEMRLLLDSYFYSVLNYNAVIWLTPELCSSSKQALLSISANALRSCMMSNCSEVKENTQYVVNVPRFELCLPIIPPPS